ncbi:hypothetical protein IAT38_001677 [Cryptococcus sp. DSM 104549]
MPPSPPASPLRLLLLSLHKPRFLALLLAIPLFTAVILKFNASLAPHPHHVKIKGTSQGGSWEALASGDEDDDWGDGFGLGSGDGGWGVKDWFKWSGDVKKSLLITGGAGQLGQSLIPALVDTYSIHVFDITPRPSTLPKSIIYHRSSPRSSFSETYASLFASNTFDGVIHLAGISLDAWCEPREAECARVNEGGTKELVKELEGVVGRAKRGRAWREVRVPWVIMGSTMDVFGLGHGDNGEGERDPVTALGRTKLAAERVLEDAVTRQTQPDGLRAMILRFPEVYGFPQATSIPETFIPSLLTNALTSLPIQYSSDHPPLDLLHEQDAVAGVLRAIDFISASRPDSTSVPAVNLVSGERWPPRAIVELVRTETKSMSPVRSLGSGHPPTAVAFGLAHAAEVLGWAPKVDLTNGLGMAIAQLSEDIATYSRAYLHDHCAPTTDFPSPDGELVTKFVEDERNRPLWKLDGCMVNMGFDHDGWMHHVKCEDGVHCVADGVKVTALNWNQTAFIVRRVNEGGREEKKERSVRVMFEDEHGRGYLGLRRREGEEVALELVKSDRDEAQTVFDLEVADGESSLRLVIPDTETQVHALANTTDESTWFTVEPLTRWVEPHFDLRLNTLCCPSQGDWPLLLDDFESADMRFGSTGQIPFNASRRLHLCHRAEQAVRYNFRRLSSARQTVSKVTGALEAQAFADETGPKTDKRPHEWALKDLPACWNDCDSPTVCVQTGECKCVQADHCQPRRANPLYRLYPASAQAEGSEDVASPLGTLAGHHPVLSKTVAAIDWRDVLLPSARAALDAHPEFIKVHVVSGWKDEQEVESHECHKLQTSHCFSADSIMYRALRHISGPKEEAELVVLPVYQQCKGTKFLLHDLVHHAAETVPGVKTGEKTVALVLTHDWGICVAFAWEIWSARDNHRLYPDWILNNILVWSVMGDYDSPCYRPHQDVVVPARTCRSVTLRETFPTVESIRPMRERKRLMTWSGTYWGTGKSDRLRLTCNRGGAGVKEMVKGGGAQSNFGSWDYMNDLGDAMFCPQPRGIAGWSPRTNDAIYAGCIPVLIAEGSHYPFSTFLDWSKFSVRIAPTELDRIEEILSAIPLAKVEEMQANLVSVREAFLYSTDEKPEEELERRGPMFFALHEAGMRLRTRYPVKEAE